MYRSNAGDAVPFSLAQCLQKTTMRDEDLAPDETEHPGAFMRVYMPRKPSAWQTTTWYPEPSRGKSMQDNFFQWDAAVEPWPLKLNQNGVLSVNSIKDVKYYLDRWARPELVEEWAEEVDNQPVAGMGSILAKRGKKKTKNKRTAP